MLSLMSFILFAFTFKSLTHFVLIVVGGVKKGSDYSFVCGYALFLPPFVEGIILSLYWLAPCGKKSIDYCYFLGYLSLETTSRFPQGFKCNNNTFLLLSIYYKAC